MKEDKQKIILEFMKKENLRSLEVIFDQEGEPDRVKVKQVKSIDTASRLYENLKKTAFQTLTIKTRSGNIAYAELVTLHKLKTNI